MGVERGSWSWGISWRLTRCVPLRLLQHSHRSQHPLPLLQAMHPFRWACPGKLAASRVKTLPSSQMAPSVARPGSRWLPMSGAGKPMGACVWWMQVASAVAAPALCASSVNGMAARPPNRARSVCYCIPSSSGLHLCSGATGADDSTDGRACNCFATSAWKCEWSPVSLLARLLRLCPCPGHNARTIVSTGLSGSRATRESQ
jgi:hypothetical protein